MGHADGSAVDANLDANADAGPPPQSSNCGCAATGTGDRSGVLLTLAFLALVVTRRRRR
jgi:MYXO-CTERM domain-containing protein